MVQRLKISGQQKYVEFTPIIEEEIDAISRKWILQNGSISLKFIEEPLGQFKDFIDFPKDIELDNDTKEELKVQIFEVIDNHIAQKRHGIEPTEEKETNRNNYPYDPKDISINNYNWSVDYISQLLAKNIINLSPDFQRNFVWDYKRKCRLIESILLGIPVPAFYLAKSGKTYNVVDGLQRLTTIKQFLNNEFPLKYLEYLNRNQSEENNLEGRYFKNEEEKKKGLGDEYEFQLKGTQFNVNVIDGDTPTQVKFDVFRRVNTGGKPLNNQEIRNCMLEEAPRQLINKLAKSKEFVAATGGSVSTTRMNSQELVMRFIGFWFTRIYKLSPYIIRKKEKNLVYQGDMQSFLDQLVEVLNFQNSKFHDYIEKDFKRGMVNAYLLFRHNCFRKCLPEHLNNSTARRQLINKSLFTTWSISLSQVKSNLIQKKFPKIGSFAIVLAKELEHSRKHSSEISNISKSDNGKKLINYYEAVSISTNDKIMLDFAFEKTEALVEKHIL
ncbi:MAG: DUF262 domain-containing protein [Saprospiraceae bacterium]